MVGGRCRGHAEYSTHVRRAPRTPGRYDPVGQLRWPRCAGAAGRLYGLDGVRGSPCRGRPGPDTAAKVYPAGATWAGIRFAPGLAPSLLGVPAVEIADARPYLADVWPRSGMRFLPEQEPTTEF